MSVEREETRFRLRARALAEVPTFGSGTLSSPGEREHLRPREKKRFGAGVLVLNKIRDVEKSFLKTVSSEKTRSCSIIYP